MLYKFISIDYIMGRHKMIDDPKITKQHLIDGIRFRLDEIDEEEKKARLDKRAAEILAGHSCCSSCYFDGVLDCLYKERMALGKIMEGYYGKLGI